MVAEERMEALEERTRALEARVAELEAAAPSRRPAPPPRGSAAPSRGRPRPGPPARVPAAARAEGRVARGAPHASGPPRGAAGDAGGPARRPRARWVGGLAVLVGIVFLLAIAVSRGWIGEEARTTMAGLTSLGCSASACGCSSIVAAPRRRWPPRRASPACSRRPSSPPPSTTSCPRRSASLGAVAVGARRHRARGPLARRRASPRWASSARSRAALVGAPERPGTIALLFVAASSAAAVLLWQRWNWLAFATFLLTVPQWPGCSERRRPSGRRARHRRLRRPLCRRRRRLRGARERAAAARRLDRPARAQRVHLRRRRLVRAGLASRAGRWLVVLAAAHIAAGPLGLRSKRVSHELSLVALGLGSILADVAFSLSPTAFRSCSGGPRRAVGFAGLVKARQRSRRPTWRSRARPRRAPDARARARARHRGSGRSPSGNTTTSALALAALGAVAVGCFVSARLAAGRPRGLADRPRRARPGGRRVPLGDRVRRPGAGARLGARGGRAARASARSADEVATAGPPRSSAPRSRSRLVSSPRRTRSSTG